MTKAAPTRPPPPDAPNPSRAAQDLAEQIAALRELIQAGADLVGVLEGDHVAEVADAYCRISRSVRLSIILQNRLQRAKSRRAPKAAGACGPGAAPQTAPAQNASPQPAPEALPLDPDVRAAPLLHACEIEDEEEDFSDILQRPFSEIIAYIYDQLGIVPDWNAIQAQPGAQHEKLAGHPFPPPRWWDDEDAEDWPDGGDDVLRHRAPRAPPAADIGPVDQGQGGTPWVQGGEPRERRASDGLAAREAAE